MEELLAALASWLQIDADTWLPTLKKAGGTDWLEGKALTDKVEATVSERLKSLGDEQHKRGKRTQLEAVETFLKGQEGFDPEGKKGLDALRAFAEWKGQTAGDEGDHEGEITEDKLVKLPAFKTVKVKLLQTAEQQRVAIQKEFDEYKLKAEGNRVQDVVRREAARVWEEKGAVLEVPALKIQKATRLDALYRLIDFSNYAVGADGKPVVLDPETKEPLKDKFGNPVPFDAHVYEVNKAVFGYATQDKNKGGAQPNPSQGGEGGDKTKMTFASKADLDRFIQSEGDPAKRAQALRDYTEAEEGG